MNERLCIFFFCLKWFIFHSLSCFFMLFIFSMQDNIKMKKKQLMITYKSKKTQFVLYGHKYNTKLIYPVCEHWTEILYSENTTDTWFHPKKSFLSISVKFKSVTTFLCVLVDRGSGWGQRSSDGKADTVW